MTRETKVNQFLVCGNLLRQKNSIRFALPAAIAIAPTDILEKINLDDIKLPSFSKSAKLLFLDEYKTECVIENCYVCNEI